MKTLGEVSVQPLDTILFRGVDPVSKAIQFVEHKRKGSGDYSHAGLAVTREVLDLPFLEPGKVYVWESTMSAPSGFWSKFSDHVGDAEGREGVRFGVQLRDLALVIPAYESGGGGVAWTPFLGERRPHEEVRPELHALYDEYGHAPYTANLLDVFGVVYPKVRRARDHFEKVEDHFAHLMNHIFEKHHRDKQVEDAEHHVFCSQWVAMVYQRLKLVDVPDPRLIAPVDFTTHEAFGEPVALVPDEQQGSGI